MAAPASAAPMEFSTEGSGGNCSTCVWIRASGDITDSTAAAFDRLMRAEPHRIVHIDSPGGTISGALALGRLFRKHRIALVVAGNESPEFAASWSVVRPGTCASACLYAAFGAVFRSIADGSRIGFLPLFAESGGFGRRPPSPADRKSLQRSAGMLAEYLHEMGGTPEFFTLMLQAGGNVTYWLDGSELAASGFLTAERIVDPWRFGAKDGRVAAISGEQTSPRRHTRIFITCHAEDGRLATIHLVRDIADFHRMNAGLSSSDMKALTAATSGGVWSTNGTAQSVSIATDVSENRWLHGRIDVERTVLEQLMANADLNASVAFPNVIGGDLSVTVPGGPGLTLVRAVLSRC